MQTWCKSQASLVAQQQVKADQAILPAQGCLLYCFDKPPVYCQHHHRILSTAELLKWTSWHQRYWSNVSGQFMGADHVYVRRLSLSRLLYVYVDMCIKSLQCLFTAAPSFLHVCRRQETLQNATQSFKSLPATQQQMEELSSRLAVCASAVAVARIQMAASRGAGKS